MIKKNLTSKILIGVLFFLAVSIDFLIAQQDRYFTPNNGLSNTSFNTIAQDDDGFIWIGTNGGLNKFDGHNFYVYQNNPSDTNTLNNNAIFAIFNDSKDNLWVGTETGLNRYNKKGDNFSRIPILLGERNIFIQINGFLEDQSGSIWLSTSLGLIKLDPQTLKTTLKIDKKIESDMLDRDLMYNYIRHDNDSNFWIASDKNGLFRFNRFTNNLVNYKQDQAKNSICDNSILSLGNDLKGNLIIGTIKGGISIFDPSRNVFQTIPYFHKPGNIFNGAVYSIVTSKNGQIWVGTERNGLKTIHPDTYTLEDANDQIHIENVNDTKIHCFIDYNENLWLGIDYSGIYFKPKKTKTFYAITKNKNGTTRISNNIVKAVLLDSKNNLYIGTDGGGLNYLPAGSSTMKVFTHEPQNPASIPDNAVISIHEDNNHNIWVGTYLGGLSLFNPQKGKFTTYLIDALRKGRDFNYVTDIISDNSGNLWVATNGGGLQHFNTQYKKFESYEFVQTTNSTLKLPTFLTDLFLDKTTNTLWIGSYNGVYFWNSDKKTAGSFTAANRKLVNEAIYSIAQDSKHRIWVGTGNGLYNLNAQNQVVESYSAADGLSHNSVYGILEDGKGNLWLSTLNGLSKFDPEKRIFRNYYTFDGLAGNEFRPASCYKADNGNLYFGTTSGLVYFQPDSIHESSGFPKVVFTNLKIFNNNIPAGNVDGERTILRNSINETSGIDLLHSDKSFTIGFVAIEYSAPEKIKYSYMLEGFDQKWIVKDFNQRFATYNNLNPGTYIFKIKSTNSDGIWNDNFRSLTIEIKPPFWKTWWAYLLYAGFGVMILFFTRNIVMFRINMHKKLEIEHLEREKLEELNQSKMQFFSNVSHEFRTPLTLILGPIERLLYAATSNPLKTQYEFIHRNALRLLRLVNLLLDLQKIEKNEMKLRAGLGDVVAFIKDITYTFSELAEQKKIALSFVSFADKLDVLFDPDKLDKVLFNLLSNALKFTPRGGKIEVKISTGTADRNTFPLDEYVLISVTDTGKGIKAEHLEKIFERFYQIEGSESQMQLGTGIGLHLSKYLVELHQGKIVVRSTPGEGTQFDVYIPRGQNHLEPEQMVGVQRKPVLESIEKIAQLEPINSEAAEKSISLGKTVQGVSNLYKVLLVEDDFDIREYIKTELSEEFEILEATDGLEGLHIARTNMPDLIISDIMMPKMDGIEFCKNIKTDLNTCHIPVILLTARTSVENRIEGLETGADSYIPKPFHPQHLRIRVQKLIELRQTLISKFSKTIGFEVKEMTLTSADERFLQKAIELVKENISNPDLNIEDMGTELGMSRVHLYRKLKALTNQTPSEFVRIIRLKQAAYLLLQNKANISEIAYIVGFSSHQYFTNCFQNYFSMSPKEYSKKAMPGK